MTTDNALVCSQCGSDTFLVLPVFKLKFDEDSSQFVQEEWPLPSDDRPALLTRCRHIACSRCGYRAPIGQAPIIEVLGDLSPSKTTVFRKADGRPLIEITLGHTFSKVTRVRRRTSAETQED